VFLEFFGAGQNGQAKGFYQQQLEYMYRTGDYVMNLNAAHLKAFPGALLASACVDELLFTCIALVVWNCHAGCE
jgi:hypothetical protein